MRWVEVGYKNEQHGPFILFVGILLFFFTSGVMGVILDHYGFPDILFERVASNNSGLGGISVIGLIDIVWLFTVYHFIEKRRAKKKKENIDGDAMMIAMYGLSALYGVIILSLFFTGGLSSLITE